MYRLPDLKQPFDFPEDFETTPEGLLALGGNLLPETLINAYAKGIFPWFGPEDPILWWHPEPRLVLFPEQIQVSRSMRQFLKKVVADAAWQVVANRDFSRIMQACSQIPRAGQHGTWITESMIAAYTALHNTGYAHAIGVWHEERLVGGLYAVALGQVIFGESMFSLVPNASKLALIALARFARDAGILMIDCQQDTPHLRSLGAVTVSRRDFLQKLSEAGTNLKQPLVFAKEHDLKPWLLERTNPVCIRKVNGP